MSETSKPDSRNPGADHRAGGDDGDRRGDGSGATPAEGAPRVERRAGGTARPDRYQEPYQLSLRHLVGATVVIVLALAIGFGGQSMWLWTMLATGEQAATPAVAKESIKKVQEAVEAAKSAAELAAEAAARAARSGSSPATVPATTATSAPSDIDCPELPRVRWWEAATHQSLIGYIKLEHGGDWAPYIEKWENQKAVLEDLHRQGSSALIRKEGISIRDDDLKDYIGKIKTRIEVIKCLAAKFPPG